MNRDGNEWTPRAASPVSRSPSPVEPELTSCLRCRESPASNRRVRWATQLTVEATIPQHYSERMERAKPIKLTLTELRERVETYTKQVVNERQATDQQREILRHKAKQHKTERKAIHHLAKECDKLEQSLLQMKAEMRAASDKIESKMVHARTSSPPPERALKRRATSQRELYSDACYKARVPGIWSTATAAARPRLNRMGSLELLSF